MSKLKVVIVAIVTPSGVKTETESGAVTHIYDTPIATTVGIEV